MSRVRDWRWWVMGACLIGGLVGVAAVGFFIGQWGMSVERASWQAERSMYLARFPKVRQETREACTREFAGRIEGLEKLNERSEQALADLKAQMTDTHELAAYTLRFLGDRAKLTDARTATMLKQTRAAAAAAVAAAKKTEVVEQKVSVATASAAEAASTAKATEKKLDTATHPTAVAPSTPWAGSRR
ncbi:hypothetical protein NK8_12970 [Caballeronia sp. NK8]|uniref:hypothetical protein n=1 Tax=Caballeronia sp. NK8 TaxID=140098 RepID=UPI001BB4D22C|nr:hypothetical protein [Caballeronia sp. NK8]BCQ23172.1 hypothetical protein NK8_12970 [Caballeronia sp. NK8]